MGQLKMYAKFVWIYTTSLFLPTEHLTARIEKALAELEAEKARLAELKAARR